MKHLCSNSVRSKFSVSVMIAQWDSSLSVLPVARVQFSIFKRFCSWLITCQVRLLTCYWYHVTEHYLPQVGSSETKPATPPGQPRCLGEDGGWTPCRMKNKTWHRADELLVSQQPFKAEEGNGIPPQYILPTTLMDTTDNEVGPLRSSSQATPTEVHMLDDVKEGRHYSEGQ